MTRRRLANNRIPADLMPLVRYWKNEIIRALMHDSLETHALACQQLEALLRKHGLKSDDTRGRFMVNVSKDEILRRAVLAAETKRRKRRRAGLPENVRGRKAVR